MHFIQHCDTIQNIVKETLINTAFNGSLKALDYFRKGDQGIMKKGTFRFIAGVLVCSMLFGGCSAGTNSSVDLDYAAYSSAEITYAENVQFTVNGKTGQYTGDWKGDRPEGNGKLVISENDVYEGEWKNGYLSGQGTITLTENDDIKTVYTGECDFSRPSGKGRQQYFLSDGTSVCIDGDFSDMSTTRNYYEFDADEKLIDIGCLNNGNEYVSYINNDQAVGIEFIPKSYIQTQRFDSIEVYQDGMYFGETDDNGIPNGYGYGIIKTEIFRDSQSETTCHYILGSWLDGEPSGKVTHIRIVDGAEFRDRSAVEFIKYFYETGEMKNGYYDGEYTSYDILINSPETEWFPNRLIETKTIKQEGDYDYSINAELYELDPSDGYYKVPYERVNTYYFTNGEYDLQKVRAAREVPDVPMRACEGYYYCTDKYGNADYGIVKLDESRVSDTSSGSGITNEDFDSFDQVVNKYVDAIGYRPNTPLENVWNDISYISDKLSDISFCSKLVFGTITSDKELVKDTLTDRAKDYIKDKIVEHIEEKANYIRVSEKIEEKREKARNAKNEKDKLRYNGEADDIERDYYNNSSSQ